MKKNSFLSFIFSITILFLVGCDNVNPEYENIIKSDSHNAAFNTVSEISKILGKSDNDIIQIDYYLQQSESELSGFFIKNNDLSYSDAYNLNLNDYFDSWISFSEGDGMREYFTEYLNDNLVCNLHGYTNADIEYLNSLVYEDDENEEENFESAYKIVEDSTYSLEASCAEFTGNIPSPLEFNFSVSGEEPYWNADITTNNIRFSTAGGLESDLYPTSMSREGNKLIVKAENYTDDLNLNIEITKKNCVDGGIGDNHEYTVKLYNSDALFEGCADKKDSFLINQRRGKLSTFIKQTGLKYEGKIAPETLDYYLWSEGNLVSLYIYNNDENIGEEDEISFIILGKTENGFETYWMGGYDIDDETCEKYHLVDGLMDFGPFNQCPRG